MRKIISLLLSIVILVALIFPESLFAQGDFTKEQVSTSEDGTADVYIIKYKDIEKGRRDLSNRNKKVNKSFRHLPSQISTTLSKKEVGELRQDPNVFYIEKDSIVKKTGDTITENVYQIHADDVHKQGITGSGVKVAILDTGINTQSSELRVSGGTSFVPNDTTLNDRNGHGTFVAGVLAALKDDQGLVGVAPNVSLYDVKVLDANGNGTYSQVIQGIDWAIDQHMDVAVMSFAGSEYSQALEEAMQKAYDNGVLLVAAAGNDGRNSVSYPAKYTSVIGVGAVDSNNKIADFSNTGSEIELVAPGVNIEGLSLTDGQYIKMSGTSVAVPQVAGVAALVISTDYLYTNKEIRQFLDNSATSLGDSQFFGHGLVNASEVANITRNAPHSDNNEETDSVSQSVYDSVYIEKKINELYQKFNIPILSVNEQLNKGYSINDIEQALIFKLQSNWDLGKILEVIRPKNLFSTVPQVQAAAESFMTAIDAAAVGTVNLKADKAPFTLGSSAEVSTLTGAVTANESDLTLPGRNGLSFTLSRTYNSQNSNFYKQDTEAVQAASYQVTFNSSRYTQTKRGDIVTDGTMIPSEDSRNYSTFSDGDKAITWINDHPGKIFDFTDWKGPEPDGSFTRSVTSISLTPKAHQTYFQVSPIAYFRNTATQKTTEELRFPIGQGWSWNIPYVEPDYIRLPDGSTQGFENGALKTHFVDDYSYGNPKKTVTVNNLTAEHELHYKTNGLSYYFENKGRLIEIEDAYGNTIQFFYTNDQLYGQVLSEIRDAIGNSITIKYNVNQVILTQGEKKVIYNKTKRESTFLDKPWNNTTKDLLTSVENPEGNITQYNYLTDNDKTSFNFAGNSSGGSSGSVEHALLRSIQYPTGAQSIFTYESSPVTRYVGAYATTQEYRAKSRQEQIGDGKVYNLTDYNYVYDTGSSFSDDEFKKETATSVTEVITDKITTRYTYLKKFVNFKKVYGTPGCETGIQWSTCWPSSTDFLFFQTNVTGTSKDNTVKKNTELTYDLDHNIPYPKTISSNTTNVLTGQISKPVVTGKTYNSHGQVLTETDTYGTKTEYEYKDLTIGSFLSKVTKKLNSNLSQYLFYDRNPQGSATWLTVRNNDDPNGGFALKIGYEYDAFGNLTKVTATDNQNTKTINKTYEPSTPYNSAFLTQQSLQVTDVDQKITTNTQKLEYNPATGQQTKYTDGNGNYTKYEYDLLNRVTKATFMDDSNIILTYDDVNNSITSQDQTGLITVTKWNPLGLKTSEGILGSGTSSYDYDTYGRMTWSEDANHKRTNYDEYDAWGRLNHISYPDGSDLRTTYDDINSTKSTIDGESNQILETYDLLNRLTKKELVKSTGNITLTDLSYDYAGNVLTSKDGKQHPTTLTYDVLSRLSSTTVTDDVSPQTTSYWYNLDSKVSQMQYPDGNNVYKKYDEMGRMIKKTDPAGLFEKYYYDDSSNLIKYVDRKGQTQSYIYDNRNFLKSSVTPTETIGYDYDTAGRRLKMTDGSGPAPTSYDYDPVTKRLNKMTYPDGRSLAYQYDDEGNRKQMTDPFGGVTVYNYTALNQLKDIGPVENNWDASYIYKKNGLLSTLWQKNNITSTFGYNGSFLTSLQQTNQNGTVVNSFNYEPDTNFNQVKKIENGQTYDFTYDPLNRISTSSQLNEKYTYDNRGNRATQKSDNALNLNTSSYSYDEHNRLIQVRPENGGDVSYRYNGDGILYERTENGVTTRYYYDGGSLIAEGIVSSDGTTVLQARYQYGMSLNARIDASGNKQFYQFNGHGDVIGLTDSNGSILNSYAYDIWGRPLTTQETVKQPFRYSGEFYDSSTGLQYLKARWYDPSVGRFINEDTNEGQVNNPLSLNLYTYVENNPLRYTDKTGHSKEESGIGAGAGLGRMAASEGSSAIAGESSQVVGVELEELATDVAKIYERLAQEEAEELSLAAGDNIAARESAGKTPGLVQSRINIANGPTRYSPSENAGWEHVVDRHFNPGKNAGQFAASQDEVKAILGQKGVIQSPASVLSEKSYSRIIDTGQVIGTVKPSIPGVGGSQTTWMQIVTDRGGNLITTFPVPAP